MHRIFLLLASLGCLAAVACSNSSTPSGSSPDGGTCTAYVSTADLTTPTVSFQTDVLPIFQQSCSVGGPTCHGAPNETALLRPFLGAVGVDGGADAETILSGIVGVASHEDPQMKIVTANDPSQSYLMHKVDDDQCTLATDCASQQAAIVAAGNVAYAGCGLLMPQTNTAPLDVSTRDTIRRWIAQGAANN
jgi:hypothetical protein